MGIVPQGPERQYLKEIHYQETKEYYEKLGHEAEPVAQNILSTLPFIETIEHASEYDDRRQNLDFLLKLKDDGQVGVGFTIATKKESMLKDLKQALDEPVITELHNNDGAVSFRGEMPRLVLHGGQKRIWEQLVETTKAGSLIPANRMAEMQDFLTQEMLVYFKYLATEKPRHAGLFSKCADIVEKSLAQRA